MDEAAGEVHANHFVPAKLFGEKESKVAAEYIENSCAITEVFVHDSRIQEAHVQDIIKKMCIGDHEILSERLPIDPFESSKAKVLDLVEDQNHEIFKQHDTESLTEELSRFPNQKKLSRRSNPLI